MAFRNAIVDLFRDDLRRTAMFVGISAISLVVSFVWGGNFPVDPAWVAIVLCGFPILYEAVTGLVFRHDIKADVLVAIALVASIVMHEWFAAGEVAFIMELGGFLEDLSADKSRAGIEELIRMTPTTARLISDGEEEVVDAGTVEVGSRIRILPGEMVPLDGKVVSGHSYVDQSSLTGESVPVEKGAGSEVYSGTINQLGTFEMVVECSAGDSSFQKLVEIVRSTDAERTRVVRVADRWATYLVAVVFVIAALTYAFTQDVSRALTVMVVFCPCAFILATPTAVVAAVGNLSKHGIMVRDGDAIERMSQVDRIVFDKTGTLTEGRPYVTRVVAEGDVSEDELLRYAGSVEKASEHPYAKAVIERCHGLDLLDPLEPEIGVGGGIQASVDGKRVKVGSAEYLGLENVSESECTTVFVSVDGRFVGSLTIEDVLRKNVRGTIGAIRENGSECVMMTGDSEKAARHTATAVGIADFVSECHPEDKLRNIHRLQDEDHKVCMIGDGINDAPSLKAADVGIAMGGTGSAITIDVADMVIVGDEIEKIPHLQFLSRKMLSRIKINIAFGMSWNVMAVILAVTGTVGAVTGAIVHNVGSVAVVVSSFLLLFSEMKR